MLLFVCMKILVLGKYEIKVWRDPILIKKTAFFRRKKQVYVKNVFMVRYSIFQEDLQKILNKKK